MPKFRRHSKGDVHLAFAQVVLKPISLISSTARPGVNYYIPQGETQAWQTAPQIAGNDTAPEHTIVGYGHEHATEERREAVPQGTSPLSGMSTPRPRNQQNSL